MNDPIPIQEDINYRLDNGYHWRYCYCVKDRKRCYSILCARYNQKIPDKVQSLFYTFATPIADKIFRNIWYRQLTLKTSRQNMVHGRLFPNTRMTDCHIFLQKDGLIMFLIIKWILYNHILHIRISSIFFILKLV